MIITIRKLEAIPASKGEIRTPSYWVEFDSPLTSGQATLYSNASPNELLSAEKINVEIDQERVEEFQVLANSAEGFCQLTRLTQSGDYEITGQVKMITRLDNDCEVLDIWVGPGWFVLTSDEIGASQVVENDWVKFKASGVSFWDEHI